MLEIMSDVQCKHQSCRGIFMNTTRTNKREKKWENTDLARFGNCLLSRNRRGNRFYSNQSIQFTINGDNIPLYIGSETTKKGTQKLWIWIRNELRIRLETTQNMCLSTARRARRQTAQHSTLGLPMSQPWRVCRQTEHSCRQASMVVGSIYNSSPCICVSKNQLLTAPSHVDNGSLLQFSSAAATAATISLSLKKPTNLIFTLSPHN